MADQGSKLLACSAAALYGRLDIGTKDDLCIIAPTCRVQIMKYGFDRLDIDFDIANGVRHVLDVVDRCAKELHALKSSGGNANN